MMICQASVSYTLNYNEKVSNSFWGSQKDLKKIQLKEITKWENRYEDAKLLIGPPIIQLILHLW